MNLVWRRPSHALLAFNLFIRPRLRNTHNMVTAVNTTKRVARLRELMASPEINVHAFIVPSEDAHQSEYIAETDKRRAFISGFDGSAGCVVVTLTDAALFTDGRYFLQASQQLDSNWTLMKQGLPDVPTWQEYVVKALPSGSRVGIDSTLITVADACTLTDSLSAVGSVLAPIEKNLVDIVWGDEKPVPPKNPVVVHPLKYAGKSHLEKLASLREELARRNAHGVIVSALDEIAWLFNLRGSDVECNPVFFAYAVVTNNKATLYVDDVKLTDEVHKHLGPEVVLKPYRQIFEDLNIINEGLREAKQKLLINPKTSLALQDAAGKENVEEVRSFITDSKAIKNEVELEGMRQSHLRDAVALYHYFAWLEAQLNSGAVLDEVDAANYLAGLRAQQADFIGLSFDTISSTGPNGAIIHYSPHKPTAKTIDPKLIYLCDSGGQYKDGTTDVTRTYHFGEPTAHEKRCFTRVLQGHIAIDAATFPKGTSGYLLDPFARAALWKDGLDFRHGTGHGVGAFLNVHEGPHGIGTRVSFNQTPLQAGMTVTDEPGYYEDGNFGIRIENVLLVKDVQLRNNFGDRGYLGFEHVTLVPIGLNLIDVHLLSREEREWVNTYHAECLSKVGPLLEEGSLALEWLRRETQPIEN
ncbi:peptidase M24, structural domain-containing protein [Jimgerdemannia flammicorona]|uniref:Xaa-Pro aminopeptidase n=1 Tax=Jimgerdemannia flammicorona TaxID=994334 RepID=A0A433QXA5_9FUNG|nr:peptidase M24, structural domain-containing protein [Jimgerdemannia flammicorona]